MTGFALVKVDNIEQALEKMTKILQEELAIAETVIRKLSKQQALMKGLKGNHGTLSPSEIRKNLSCDLKLLKKACDDRKKLILDIQHKPCSRSNVEFNTIVQAIEILPELPKKTVNNNYKQAKHYIQQREIYLQGLKKIAGEFDEYLERVRKNPRLMRSLQERKNELCWLKNQSEGEMWQDILHYNDSYQCFIEFAEREVVLPLTELSKQLDAFKKTITMAEQVLFHPLKNYTELTTEELRINYLLGIQSQMNKLGLFVAKNPEATDLVAQINDFRDEHSSWWDWIPVFIFDWFNIHDEYRPLHAKSLDALLLIQEKATQIETLVSRYLPYKAPIFKEEKLPKAFSEWYEDREHKNTASTPPETEQTSLTCTLF